MITEHLATFDSTNIKLKISGVDYSFWKSANVHMAIGEICREADFLVSDGYESAAGKIEMDAPCTVYCDDIKVMTGYIDDVSVQYSGIQHGITIKARSKTCDLNDCSIDLDNDQFVGQKASDLIKTICRSFNINVRWLSADFYIKELNIKTGDTAGSAIDAICKQGAVFYTDDADGNLVITDLQPRASVATLYSPPSTDGCNILAGNVHYSSRDRFSEYRIYSQSRPSDEDDTAENAYSQSGTYFDKGMRRHRPKIIVADNEMAAIFDSETARAEYMRQLAAAADFAYEINGWKSADGLIWMPGAFVDINDNMAHVVGKYIVQSADLGISATSGRKTNLKVCIPYALIKDYKGKKVKITDKNPWYWTGAEVA